MPILTATERIGTELGGRYRLRMLLGEGAFGAVFEAEHMLTRRAVAVKVLHPHLIQTDQIRQRFLLEAQAMAQLRHPAIVEVLDAGQEADGALFVVMDLLKGETLEKVLERSGRLTLQEALGLTEELLEALEIAHSANIVHRDIKPANIFLAQEDGGKKRAKLLDFGIAHVADSKAPNAGKLTSAGAILGTPEYMSPEQAKGQAIGPAADLWSTGIVLYEMLSGFVPWTAENPTVVMMSIANDPLPDIREFVTDLPQGLWVLLQRALSKDPSKRFANAAQMREALNNYHEVAEPPPERPRPGMRTTGSIAAMRSVTEPGAAPSFGKGGVRQLELDNADSMELELDAPAAPTPSPVATDTSQSRPRLNSGEMPAQGPKPKPSVTGMAAVRTTGDALPIVNLPPASPEKTGAHTKPTLADKTIPPGQQKAPPEAEEKSAPATRAEMRAPQQQFPAFQTARATPTRLYAAVGVGGVALLGVVLAFAFRGGSAATPHPVHTEDSPDANREPPADARAASAELVDRLTVAPPFGSDELSRQAFARHFTVGEARPNQVRRLATCARGSVYMYQGGDGMAVASGPANISCDGYDLAVVSDLDGDGEDDLAAVSRGHDSVLLLGTRPAVHELRAVPLPRATGVVGGLRFGTAPGVLVYIAPAEPTGASQLVALNAVTGEVVWRTDPDGLRIRFGIPSDLGLAVGPDATGDGVPDVVAGSTVSPSTPVEQMPTHPRCVELLDGTNGRRVWPEPFCQRAGGSQSVALGPDVDHDNKGDIVVGSDVTRGTDPRVVLLSSATREVRVRINAGSLGGGAGFGWPVTLGPDATGDGVPDLAVGSVGSAGTAVSLVSGSDGHVVAQRSLPGVLGFPNLRIHMGNGLARGDRVGVGVSVPEVGLRVVGLSGQ